MNKRENEMVLDALLNTQQTLQEGLGYVLYTWVMMTDNLSPSELEKLKTLVKRIGSQYPIERIKREHQCSAIISELLKAI